ncbi:Phosphoenolpyruvate-protein phosphotransferase of PTS system (EC [Olavius algarvensis associated proteobacterium Delta 3]|nr:Phosphoenolpyruvate-protein phosphotransferase of PTS system (EC [Olavius algarvensis associated proteobacterium Delta 3]
MNLAKPNIEPNPGAREIILEGIGGSPGICIGKAYLVDKEGVDIVERYYLGKNELAKEKKRFKTAVKKAKDELQAIIENMPEDFQDQASILETHVVLLKDKMLYNRAIDTIERDQVNAEWALKMVVGRLKAMFRGMDDTYLKERAEDVLHVSDRIMRNLVGAGNVDIRHINKRVILVANDLSPADASQIQLERIMGFVTDRGGKASHTSIIARTLEIPAVLGVTHGTKLIQNDDIIIVDGTQGRVILSPTEETLVAYQERQVRFVQYRAVVTRDSALPAITRDGVQLRVMGNIELPEEVVSVLDNGGEGIGLYRTEFDYVRRRQHPTEDELFEKYQDVVEVMGTRPVTIRTLDINGDKAIGYESQPDQANPALSLRAIRYCLKRPDIFRTQLRAILRAAVYGNVRILFPMISGCKEIREAKMSLDNAAESLDKDGIPYNRDIDVGIMIEVPSAVILADQLAEESDFFSIGTNDLIQYSLAIDRTDQEVAQYFNPLHPAIIRMVKQVADVAGEKQIPIFMCGEMAAEPVHLPILLGIGMDELSMNPQSIPEVKRMIRSLKVAGSKDFLAEILKQSTVDGVSRLLEDTYAGIFSESLFWNDQP